MKGPPVRRLVRHTFNFYRVTLLYVAGATTFILVLMLTQGWPLR